MFAVNTIVLHYIDRGAMAKQQHNVIHCSKLTCSGTLNT